MFNDRIHLLKPSIHCIQFIIFTQYNREFKTLHALSSTERSHQDCAFHFSISAQSVILLMESTAVQRMLHVLTVLTTLLGSPPPATSRTMAATSLVSGKARVASLLWTSRPATATSNADLRPTLPRTTAPAGTVSECPPPVLLQPRTWHSLLQRPLEVPHAGGVASGAAVFYLHAHHRYSSLAQVPVTVTVNDLQPKQLTNQDFRWILRTVMDGGTVYCTVDCTL